MQIRHSKSRHSHGVHLLCKRNLPLLNISREMDRRLSETKQMWKYTAVVYICLHGYPPPSCVPNFKSLILRSFAGIQATLFTNSLFSILEIKFFKVTYPLKKSLSPPTLLSYYTTKYFSEQRSDILLQLLSFRGLRATEKFRAKVYLSSIGVPIAGPFAQRCAPILDHVADRILHAAAFVPASLRLHARYQVLGAQINLNPFMGVLVDLL